MRTTEYLGVAFVLAGCLLVLASTGAFDATHAERGMAVDTATDSNAFLGLNYSSPGRLLQLETSDRWFCLGSSCYYNDVELVRFENNTAGDLNITQVAVQESGGVGTFGDGIRYEAGPPNIGRVLGDFTCPASGGFIVPTQQNSATSTVTLDVVAQGDNLSVDLSRDITVECVAGPIN